jgi:RNA polymerase sigma-70 factor (sigma-E family)
MGVLPAVRAIGNVVPLSAVLRSPTGRLGFREAEDAEPVLPISARRRARTHTRASGVSIRRRELHANADVAAVPVGARLGAIARVAQPSGDFVDEYPKLFRDAYRIAFRLLGDREDAEDIAQEACIRACQRWRRLSDGGYATPWVAHVTTNLSLDRWRRRKSAQRYLAASPKPAPTAHDDRVDLHRALATLPRRQREVVLLRYVADLPEQEVARQLECSTGSVKTHASRGLAALRAALGHGHGKDG